MVTTLYVGDCTGFSEEVVILLNFPCFEEVFGLDPSVELDKKLRGFVFHHLGSSWVLRTDQVLLVFIR